MSMAFHNFEQEHITLNCRDIFRVRQVAQDADFDIREFRKRHRRENIVRRPFLKHNRSVGGECFVLKKGEKAGSVVCSWGMWDQKGCPSGDARDGGAEEGDEEWSEMNHIMAPRGS